MTTVPQQKPNLTSRLEALESQSNRIIAIEQLAVNLRRSLTTVVEMLNAFVEEMGGAELGARIQARLDEKRRAVRKAEADRSAAILKQLVDAGQVEAVGEITQDSIIVGLESTPDGQLKEEQLQMSLPQFNPDIQEELLGKTVGYVVQREGKNVLTVQGIYRMKDQAPSQLSETAPEAPQAAEAPVTEVKDVADLPSADQAATTPVAE